MPYTKEDLIEVSKKDGGRSIRTKYETTDGKFRISRKDLRKGGSPRGRSLVPSGVWYETTYRAVSDDGVEVVAGSATIAVRDENGKRINEKETGAYSSLKKLIEALNRL